MMDESHRYRGSAGINAINELKPILGLELTAAPQVETGQKNDSVQIYSYPLSQAADGLKTNRLPHAGTLITLSIRLSN